MQSLSSETEAPISSPWLSMKLSQAPENYFPDGGCTEDIIGHLHLPLEVTAYSCSPSKPPRFLQLRLETALSPTFPIFQNFPEYSRMLILFPL